MIDGKAYAFLAGIGVVVLAILALLFGEKETAVSLMDTMFGLLGQK